MSKIGQCSVCGETRKLGKSHKKCHPCLYQARKARMQNRCTVCSKLLSLNASALLCKSCGRKGELSPNWKGGTQSNSGYRLTRMPEHPNSQRSTGYVMEHIVVMTEHLGRPLLPGETVHHKNGVRDDNRIENLELWSTSQPYGQRVADKVEWAKQILALYGPDFADTTAPKPVAHGPSAAAKALQTAIAELLETADRLDSIAGEIV
ncbi:HNH endonuclease signature motif containing protein [Streptomyces sp. OM5714]|uniref:HNH endonuclease signature motif containing protein n=1 Tax=Streptomyces sp. OM5714 TaxID=2602736 RepID=UPI0013DAC3A0|nr:HNH endonuclease signature motif containing protein [Streptomyces sp. OM5714]KAF2774639.1 hypothetical protein STPH1_7684 [Streptomyces sp. OM5714]